jgi:hypothetical protein
MPKCEHVLTVPPQPAKPGGSRSQQTPKLTLRSHTIRQTHLPILNLLPKSSHNSSSTSPRIMSVLGECRVTEGMSVPFVTRMRLPSSEARYQLPGRLCLSFCCSSASHCALSGCLSRKTTACVVIVESDLSQFVIDWPGVECSTSCGRSTCQLSFV